MIERQKFIQECIQEILSQGEDEYLLEMTKKWFKASFGKKYPYHFDFLGRPIIQYPQDMVAIQEIIWKVKPDLIIETGIAHGGSLILSASMLAQLDMIEAIESGKTIDPKQSKRKVLGIDIDILEHNNILILSDITKHFEYLVETNSNLVNMAITSATELSAEEVEHIKSNIESQLNKKIDVRTEIDKSLIGGVRLRVGNIVIDNTISRRLDMLKNTLTQA